MVSGFQPNSSVGKPLLPPFVGCFKTAERFYIYDVNTNEVIDVPDNTFSTVVDAVNTWSARTQSDMISDRVSRMLLDEGYLSSNRPRACSGIDASHYKELTEHHIEHCVLELTQQCNQRCSYCPYSRNDMRHRAHSLKKMTWATARSAIDFLIQHSDHLEEVSLGFYGGEPLLAWPLMARCIEYTETQVRDRRVRFNFTTNGTCVTEEIAGFCRDHNVSVLVSLDGPRDVHDEHRLFHRSAASAYARTLDGIVALRSAYGADKSYRIKINCVYGPWSDHNRLAEFFEHNPPREIDGLDYNVRSAALPQDSLNAAANTYEYGGMTTEQASREELYREWLSSFAAGIPDMGRDRTYVAHLFERPLLTFYKRPRARLGETIGLIGMCPPGVKRLFINVEGDLLFCERVPDSTGIIGNVEAGGIDMERVMHITKMMERTFTGRCSRCIFCRLCTGCVVGYADTVDVFSMSLFLNHCRASAQYCRSIIMDWARCLEQNAACLDYMGGVLTGR